MDSVLRPRDIQARIRSGESPETVAAAAQTSVDKIMGFATPVLAERAYVAEQALKASVRRRGGDGPAAHLRAAVEQHLATKGIDPEQLSWDAWRREDGRWTLVADYPDGGPRAQFVYDAAGRYVVAEDDEARGLVGERTPAPSVPQPAPAAVAPEAEAADEHDAQHPEFTDGTEDTDGTDGTEDTEQLPLGDDAIGLITGTRATTGRPPVSDDWMQTQATERTRAPEPEQASTPTLFDTLPTQESSPGSGPVVEPEQTETAEAVRAPADQVDQADVPDQPDQPEQPAKRRKSSKSKRASVPSWDEIMFGSGKGE